MVLHTESVDTCAFLHRNCIEGDKFKLPDSIHLYCLNTRSSPAIRLLWQRFLERLRKEQYRGEVVVTCRQGAELDTLTKLVCADDTIQFDYDNDLPTLTVLSKMDNCRILHDVDLRNKFTGK